MNTRTVEDLDAEIEALIADGYRLDMIMPADAPREALMSKNGEDFRLTSLNPNSEIRNPKSTGRAGMEYRDLIPDRLDGRLIASHIRIANAGPVPDYVHYHKIGFQMIYCKAGWVRVVYEDQGPPFLLEAGDCVLQPPEIRHRVLEASAGAEVIELSSPAEHETWIEHESELPTNVVNPGRSFGGQTFVRHIAGDAVWEQWDNGFESRDLGTFAGTGGILDAKVIRTAGGGRVTLPGGGPIFLYVLNGSIKSRHDLGPDECILLAGNDPVTINAMSGTLVLKVSMLSR